MSKNRTIVVSIGLSVKNAVGSELFMEIVGKMTRYENRIRSAPIHAGLLSNEIAPLENIAVNKLIESLENDKRTCAELDTLNMLNPKVNKNDKIVIFAPDNIEAYIAMRIMQRAIMKKYSCKSKVTVIKDFNMADIERLENSGCYNLIEECSNILSESDGEKVVCISGGYKAMTAYLTIVGVIYGAEVVYIHETGTKLHSLPKGLILQPNLEIWQRFFPIFARVVPLKNMDHVPLQDDEYFGMLAQGHIHHLEPYFRVKGVQVEATILGELVARAGQLVYCDTMTGMFNRDCIDHIIKIHHCERWKGGGLIMFDLDHFKRINDNYGHYVGDLVLGGVAQKIIEACTSDVYPVRYGGEEMMVLAPSKEPPFLEDLAERILFRIRSETFTEHRINITITAGIAYADRLGGWKDFDSLYKQADSALYQGKEIGRDCVVVFNE